MSTGYYWDDWIVGEVRVTPSRTITAADGDAFAEIEGGKNEMHLDPEYAQSTIWGRMSVHGLLTVSMASGLMELSGLFAETGLAFLSLTWNFRAAVFVDDEIRVRWWASEKRPTSNPERGLVMHTIEVLNQDDELVCEGGKTTLFARRP